MSAYRCIITIMLFSVLLMLFSCTNPQQKLRDEITEAEKKLNPDSLIQADPAEIEKLTALYMDFAVEFPDDTSSPDYLFKAGQANMQLGRFEMAMDNFSRVRRYPNYRNTPASLFMMGFVADNNLKDKERAKKMYEEFILTYPDHPLAKDAKMMITQLNLTPEELIRQFEARSESDSSTGSSTQ